MMTKVMPVSQVRADIYNIIDETAQTHEPILITGKRNNAVMISQEDWENIEETLYLNSIKGLTNSIIECKKTNDDEFCEEIEW